MARATQIRIKPNGPWHRPSQIDGHEDTTACGEVIPGAFACRDALIDADICKRCHSRHEIDTGELKKLERSDDGDDSVFFDDDEAPTDPNGEPIPVK